MKLTQWVAGGAAAAAVMAGALLAVPAMADDGSTPDAAAASCTLIHRPWRNAPEALRTDVADAMKLPAGKERVDALRQVRTQELDGAYGDGVREFALHSQGVWVAAWRGAPDALKDDIKALRSVAAGTERHDAAVAIFDAALAGDYGPVVQARAQARQDCTEGK